MSGYCLNLEHKDGKHKARVFRAALGLTAENSDELRQALLYASVWIIRNDEDFPRLVTCYIDE